MRQKIPALASPYRSSDSIYKIKFKLIQCWYILPFHLLHIHFVTYTRALTSKGIYFLVYVQFKLSLESTCSSFLSIWSSICRNCFSQHLQFFSASILDWRLNRLRYHSYDPKIIQQNLPELPCGWAIQNKCYSLMLPVQANIKKEEKHLLHIWSHILYLTKTWLHIGAF